MWTKLKFILACVVLAGLAAGCESSPKQPAGSLQTISVSPGTQTIGIGETVAADAVANYSNGGTMDLAGLAGWSSDTANCSVDGSGVVTGVAVGGPCNVSAQYAGVDSSVAAQGNVAVITVVKVIPTFIQVAPGFVTLATATGTFQLTATADTASSGPVDITTVATWTSASPLNCGVVAGLVTGILTATTCVVTAAYAGVDSNVAGQGTKATIAMP